MDGRGGCCIARYAGGGAYDMSNFDRIMLRFRPIAPKPATGSSGGSSPEMSEVSSPRCGRGKRRHSNSSSGNKRCNNGRKRKGAASAAVTLALLPETPDWKESTAEVVQTEPLPTWLSFGSNVRDRDDESIISRNFGVSGDLLVLMHPRHQMIRMGSCVTVECVTDTWMVDVDGLGRTDEEREINMGIDTCPGFISDEYGRVTWTNEAYKKMVVDGCGGGGDCEAAAAEEVVVWLVMKDDNSRKVPVTVALACHRAFTCRVRVQNYFQHTSQDGIGKERSSITVPCDAWRMDAGGFAWRLDVKAALCLGR